MLNQVKKIFRYFAPFLFVGIVACSGSESLNESATNQHGLTSAEQIILWGNIDKLETEKITGKILGKWFDYAPPNSVYVVEQNQEGFIFHKVYPKVTTKEDNWGPISETFKAEWDGNNMKFYDPCCEGEWYIRFPNGEMRFQSDLGTDSLMPKAIRPESP